MRFALRNFNFTVLFHSFLLGICGSGTRILLTIDNKFYLNKILQISGINPVETSELLLINKISFLIKIFLVTEFNARDKIICRNISLRDSIWEGSRFSPSIDSAMSERVEVGNPWMRLMA